MPTPGAAYVFIDVADGVWSEKQKLLSSNRALGDRFGTSLAIHNYTLAVGSYGHNSGAGERLRLCLPVIKNIYFKILNY